MYSYPAATAPTAERWLDGRVASWAEDRSGATTTMATVSKRRVAIRHCHKQLIAIPATLTTKRSDHFVIDACGRGGPS